MMVVVCTDRCFFLFLFFFAQLNVNSRGASYDVSVWTDMTKSEYKALQTYGKVRKAALYI